MNDFETYWVASDSLFHTGFIALMKEELWIPFTNIYSTRLSFPEGLVYGHYPMTDWLHWMGMYLLSWCSSTPMFAYNFYYLIAAGLISITMGYLLMNLGLSLPLALAGALIYSNLPLGLERLHHLFLSAYFQVPLIFYILLNYRTQLPKWQVFAFGVIVGATGVYYAFFSSALTILIFLALWSLSFFGKYTGSLRVTFSNFGIFLVGKLGFLFLSLLPSLIYIAKHGASENNKRSPQESLIWGLDIQNIVLPPTSHWFPPYAAVRPLFFSWERLNFMAPYEGYAEYLGLISWMGLVFCLVVLWNRFRGDYSQRKTDQYLILSFCAVVCLGFALKYGLGYLFAITVSPQLRSWNRASLFVATAGIIAFFIWLQPRISAGTDRWRLVAFSFTLALFGLAEQGTIWRPVSPDYAQTTSDIKFSKDLKEAIGDKVILGLPFGVFPEWRGYSSVETYGNFRYLMFEKIRAVFPTIKGTKESLPKLNLFFGRYPDLYSLKQYGISGLVIDKADYPDQGQDALSAYMKRESVTFVSPDGRFQFISLD